MANTFDLLANGFMSAMGVAFGRPRNQQLEPRGVGAALHDGADVNQEAMRAVGGHAPVEPPTASPEPSQSVRLRVADDLKGPDGTGSTDGSSGPRPEDLIDSEEERRLVQRVFLLPNDRTHHIVLFTSVDRHRDAGTICARVSEILSEQVDGSVCVVDANLREPSLHHYFATPTNQGLADVLRSDGDELMALQQRSNLWFVPGGRPAAEAGALFRSARGRTVFKELRSQFDYVLVHAAPLGNASESVLLGRWTDGAVLVVEAHKTRRESARRVKSHFESAQVPLLGVVLTNRRYPIPEFVYRWL